MFYLSALLNEGGRSLGPKPGLAVRMWNGLSRDADPDLRVTRTGGTFEGGSQADIFGLVTPTDLARSLSDNSVGEFADHQIRDLRGRYPGIFVVKIRLFREVLPLGDQSGLFRFFQDGEFVVDEGLNLFSKLRDLDHVLLDLLFTNNFQNLVDHVCGDRRHEYRKDKGEEPVGAAADDVRAPLQESPFGHERPDGRGGECRSDPPADDQRGNSTCARDLI